MKHARLDYQRIQDPDKKIPHDEPVFLLRGQDRLAAQTVEFYAKLCRQAAKSVGLSPTERAALIECAEQSEAHIKLMEAWGVKKFPDLQHPDAKSAAN